MMNATVLTPYAHPVSSVYAPEARRAFKPRFGSSFGARWSARGRAGEPRALARRLLIVREHGRLEALDEVTE